MPAPSSHHEHGDERLTAWLDGELSPADAAQLQRDLEADPALANELARARRTRDLLRTAPPVPTPFDLTDSILDRLDEEPAPTGASWRWRGLALAAAALLVLWIALPSRPPAEALPEPPPVAATSLDEGTIASAPAVVLVSSRWLLATEADDAVMQAIVRGAGGTLQQDGDTLVVRAPAEHISDVRRALMDVGVLQDDGDRRPAAGKVRVELEILRR